MPTVFEAEAQIRSTGADKAIGDIRKVGREYAGVGDASEGASKRSTVAMGAIAGASATAALAIGRLALSTVGDSFRMEEALTRIPALVGDVGMSVDDMRSSVLALSGETARPAQELADALFAVTSAGFSGEEAMAVLDRSARAAAAGLGDTGTVALAVGSSVNAYGSQVLSASTATDIMVGTVKAGNLAADQLAGSLGKILPIAAAAKVPLEDIGGGVALITRSGASASEATTQLKAAIQAINAPTAEAAKLLNEAGVSTEDLRSTLQEDGLVAAMNMLRDAAGGNPEVLRRMVGSSEALSAVLTVTNADADTLASTFGAVADSAGLADDAFNTTAESGAFKNKKALNDLKVAMEGLMGTVAPLITTIAGFATTLIEGFSGLPDVAQKLILVGGGAGIAASKFGPLLKAGGGVAKMATTLAPKLLAMNPALGAIGIGAAVAIPALISMTRKSDDVGDAVKRMKDKLVDASGAMDTTTDALAGYLETASRFNARNQIDDIDRLGLSWGDLNDMMRGGRDGLADFVQAAVDSGEITQQAADGLLEMADSGASTEDMLARLKMVSGFAQAGNTDLIASFLAERDAMQDTAESGVDLMKRMDKVTDAQVDAAIAANTAADGQVDWIAVQESLQATLDDTTGATDTLTGATGDLTGEISGTVGVAGDLTDQFDGMLEAYDRLIGRTLDAEEADFKFRDSLSDLSSTLADNGTDLDVNSEAGRRNRDAIRDVIGAAEDHITALKDQGRTMEDIGSAFDGHIQDLRDEMTQAGLTEGQIDDLLESYGLTPDNIRTVIETENLTEAMQQVGLYRLALGEIPGSITTSVNVRTGQTVRRTSSGAGHGKGAPVFFERGGFVDAPIGAEIPAVLHGGEYVLSAKDVGAIRAGVPMPGPSPIAAGRAAGGGGGVTIGAINVTVGLGGDQVGGDRIARQIIGAIQNHELAAGRVFTRDDAPGLTVR